MFPVLFLPGFFENFTPPPLLGAGASALLAVHRVTLLLSLFLVLLFTFTVGRRVTRTRLALDRPLLGRVTALVSLTLWFGVAWGGRWIGFS